MENDELGELQRVAERAEAAPWVEHQPTPTWVPPAVGGWAALLTFVLSEPAKGWLLVLCVTALIAAEGALIGWYRHSRGTMPTGRPPVEMRPAAAGLVVGVLVLVGVVVPIAHLTPTWVPVSIAFVLTASLSRWYEQAYLRAAAATRARLA